MTQSLVQSPEAVLAS